MMKNQDVAKNLVQILFAVTHLCRNEMKHTEGAFKITFTQFKILSAIRRGMTQISLLSEELNTSQPAMSKMVDALVKIGFLRRASSTTDRRKVHLELTSKGETAFESVRQRVCKSISARLSTLSKADQKQAEVIILKILAALEQEK